MANKKSTRTSRFGSSGRENHDASLFYSSRLYNGAPVEDTRSDYQENPIPPQFLDQVLEASSQKMSQLPDCSIHLMVTSPPYNVRKEYDKDLSLDEYLDLLSGVINETHRVLVPGGRACINIANLGRKPYIPLNGFISQMMMAAGFLMRGEIIWDKAASGGASTAWGSWMSASNPTLRDVHEYILVFSKGRFKRPPAGREPTITRDEFLEYTRSIWSFPTESARRVGHPAPFPVALPYRLIQLYTFAGEIILDPFMGSGTTAIAALTTRRHFVGYEVNGEYIRTAQERIQELVTKR
jgi:site-specific DNA-methyltransferase (adenine-specific)